MTIDHIGIVVKSLEEGIAQWTTMFGYRPLTAPVVNSRQRVRVVFLEKAGSPLIKLIEAVDDTSTVHRFALRGGGLHHLCFRCDDLPAAVAGLRDQGARLLTAPQPGEAFGGEDIAFVFAGNGLNIELIATDTKADRLPRA
jgi:methylmalonyl-CoA/ethylmalonyl-CoA epimerase